MLYVYEDLQFTDELLGKEVLQAHVDRAEQGLYAFAKRLGVEQGDIVRSFLVDELVMLYINRFVCVDKAYALPGAYTRDGSTDDFYSKKLSYIDQRISVLEKQITPEELTGDPKKYARYRTVEIFRG